MEQPLRSAMLIGYKDLEHIGLHGNKFHLIILFNESLFPERNLKRAYLAPGNANVNMKFHTYAGIASLCNGNNTEKT